MGILDTCAADKVCIELIKGAPAGFVALVVGVLGLLVAWRQYRVAQAKLRFDLYTRRLNIYEACVDFYNALIGGSTDAKTFDEARLRFLNAVREARFLFSKKSGVPQAIFDMREGAFAIEGFKEHSAAFKVDQELWRKLYDEMLDHQQEWHERLVLIEERIAPYMHFHKQAE